MCNQQGQIPADIARSKGHSDTAVLLDMLAVKYRAKKNSPKMQEPPCSTESACKNSADSLKSEACAIHSTDNDQKIDVLELSDNVIKEKEGLPNTSQAICSSETECKITAHGNNSLKSCATCSSTENTENVKKEEGRPKNKVEKPCIHCQKLTHRRCARCRTVYMCSHDCQVATLAVHKPLCLEIYAEREKIKSGKEGMSAAS